MTTRSLALITAGLMSAALASSAGAAHIVEFGTPGNSEGFYDFGNRITGETVSGGVLSGTINDGDAQLRRFQAEDSADNTLDETNFSFNLSDYTSLTFSLAIDTSTSSATGTQTYSVVFYNTDPATLNVNPSGATAPSVTYTANLDSTDGSFNVYTIDFSTTPTSGTFANFEGGVVEGYRIDPINGADSVGSTFQLDYVRLVAVPEPTAIAGLAGDGLLALRRRRA